MTHLRLIFFFFMRVYVFTLLCTHQLEAFFVVLIIPVIDNINAFFSDIFSRLICSIAITSCCINLLFCIVRCNATIQISQCIKPVKPPRIHQIHRIVQHIPIEVAIATRKEDGILACPLAGKGIIFTIPKVRQPGVGFAGRMRCSLHSHKRIAVRAYKGKAVYNAPNFSDKKIFLILSA